MELKKFDQNASPPPSNNFCLYPPPVLRCFWKDLLMTPTTSLQASFTATPSPSTTSPPPPKNFDHTLIGRDTSQSMAHPKFSKNVQCVVYRYPRFGILSPVTLYFFQVFQNENTDLDVTKV